MHMLVPNAARHMRAQRIEDVPSVMRRGTQGSIPAHGHKENVSGMAFSHWLHDRAAQQLGRSAWLRQRFHARNVCSRSALTAWRELCRHTATRYWPKACVRSTRATPPHALTLTLACPCSSAWPSRYDHTWSCRQRAGWRSGEVPESRDP